MAANRRIDEILHTLITARGLPTDRPEVNFLTVTMDSGEQGQPDPIRLAAHTSRAFLGLRIDCLQCHDDYLGTYRWAAAALIDLLEQRELLETTLVVIAGEFGRTPRINAAEGRDHWVHGFSVMLAGCAVRGGIAHGATAADADLNLERPADAVSDSVSIADVHATILSTLGLNPLTEDDTPIGRPMRLSDDRPIAGIIKPPK